MNMIDCNFDFCKKFNYPDELSRVLRKVIAILKRDVVVSIMVLGSLPRGELSYKLKNKKLVLFSDIDILVVTRGQMSTEEQSTLIRASKNVGKEFQPSNPLFDISIEFLPIEDVKKLPHKVRFYDLRYSGETLFGEDIRHMIPDVDKHNLHRQDTNSILLRRLLSLLLYFPRVLFTNKDTVFARDVFKYIIARDTLHIATILLFQKGIFLPTYRERVEYIVSHSNTFMSDFDSEFPTFLKRCLRTKLAMDFSQSLTSLYAGALKYYRLLLIYTLQQNGVAVGRNMSLAAVVHKSKKDIFGEADITRVKFDFVLRSPNFNLLTRRIKSLSSPFLGYMLFFLFNMNEAVRLFFKGDRDCFSVLDNAWWVLSRLRIVHPKEKLPLDFVNRFFVLREKFFFDFYVAFMSPGEADHITEVLSFEYE